MAYTQGIVLFLILNIMVHANFYNDIAKFCHMNGLNYITLSSLPHINKETPQIINALWNHNLMLRQLSFDEIQTSYALDNSVCLDKNVICPLDPQLYQDSIVLLAKSNQLRRKEIFQIYLYMISIAKVKRGLLVFTTPFSDLHKTLLYDLVKTIDNNTLFYVIYKEANTFNTHYMQVISIRKATKAIINSIELDQFGHIIERYDLNKLKIYGITLSWAPFFTVENCDFEGKNCDQYGFYGDFMDECAKIMNFTWESHADPEGNWGVRPISGPFNISGLWGGAFGSVVNGDYMISLSHWLWNIDRYGLLDFVSSSTDTILLALTPKPPDVDTGLFVRPFTNDAWTGKWEKFAIFWPFIRKMAQHQVKL